MIGTRALLFLLAGLLWTVGCARKPEKPPPPAPPEVVVRTPLVQKITETEEFTGVTRAVQTIEIRARVTGYLDKVFFQDGKDVEEGTPLFLIDPRTYKAEFDKAEATLQQNEATLERLTADYRRAQAMMPGRAISLEEIDKIRGNRNEADAAVKAARAAMESAKLNLAFTRVTAPITGRLSRRLVDPGNLVKADDTVLTTIVSLNPIHAYFDIDERTVLKLRRMIQEKKIDSARHRPIQVKIGLADEDGYSRSGTIDFIDNQLDQGTGSLRVRATLENPPINGTYTLSPNMFVRVQLPVGTPQESLLVPEAALVSDQGNKFLFVLNSDNQVEARRVLLGQHELIDGESYRVIKTPTPTSKTQKVGLQAGERVIVTGLQRVREGITVTPLSPEVIAQRAHQSEQNRRTH
ncbi:MAG: efflux RND transporter periplasmic adaptor subunit [Gemmataceae bacterium]